MKIIIITVLTYDTSDRETDKDEHRYSRCPTEGTTCSHFLSSPPPLIIPPLPLLHLLHTQHAQITRVTSRHEFQAMTIPSSRITLHKALLLLSCCSLPFLCFSPTLILLPVTGERVAHVPLHSPAQEAEAINLLKNWGSSTRLKEFPGPAITHSEPRSLLHKTQAHQYHHVGRHFLVDIDSNSSKIVTQLKQILHHKLTIE